jgi:hypothetical protein
MPGAVAGLRADQARLREQMSGLGVGCEQIAPEFARRYRLDPRVAWRHAYGWSLSQAASQINVAAGAVGLDRDGRAALLPALRAPGDQRVAGLTRRVQRVAGMLTAPACRGSRPACQLGGGIGEFAAGASRQAAGR